MPRSQVAVVSTTPETVLEDVERAMALGGAGALSNGSNLILLALQLRWNRPFPGVNTQPWQLDGVVRALSHLHRAPDRMLATGGGHRRVDPHRALDASLLDSVLRRHGVTFRPRHELPHRPQTLQGPFLRWSHLEPREVGMPEALGESAVVCLPTLSTHSGLVLAGAVYALANLLLGELPPAPVMHLHELLVDVLQVRRELGLECLVLMDATVCGDGAGPGTPRPSLQNVLLSSRDPLALDAVAASMMGFVPREIPFVRMATERGLGQGRLEEIAVVGEEIAGVDFGLQLRQNLASWGTILEGGVLRRQMSRWASGMSLPALYRDAVWYPLVGRSLARHYRRTNWGRLFEHYRALGSNR